MITSIAKSKNKHLPCLACEAFGEEGSSSWIRGSSLSVVHFKA